MDRKRALGSRMQESESGPWTKSPLTQLQSQLISASAPPRPPQNNKPSLDSPQHTLTLTYIYGDSSTRIFVTINCTNKTHAEHGTRPLGRGQDLGVYSQDLAY